MIEFDVYGTRVGVVREGEAWLAFFLGDEGKRRPAHGVVIPDWISESELTGFLADLFHEAASPERPEVVRLD